MLQHSEALKLLDLKSLVYELPKKKAVKWEGSKKIANTIHKMAKQERAVNIARHLTHKERILKKILSGRD